MLKFIKKSGKYAEKSIMIYIELSDIMSKVLAFKCKYNWIIYGTCHTGGGGTSMATPPPPPKKIAWWKTCGILIFFFVFFCGAINPLSAVGFPVASNWIYSNIFVKFAPFFFKILSEGAQPPPPHPWIQWRIENFAQGGGGGLWI